MSSSDRLGNADRAELHEREREEKKENKLSLPNVPCLFKQEIITRELAGDVVYQYARLGARTMMTIVL